MSKSLELCQHCHCHCKLFCTWIWNFTDTMNAVPYKFLYINFKTFLYCVSTNSHVPLQNLLSEPSHNLLSPVLNLSKFRIIVHISLSFLEDTFELFTTEDGLTLHDLRTSYLDMKIYTWEGACETWGAHSSSDKDSSLLGCYATSTRMNSYQLTWCNIPEHLKIKHSTHLYNPNYC